MSQITDDSREADAGSLFFAIPGKTQDGNRFIEDALARGAKAIVVESEDQYLRNNHSILVSSVRKAFASAACAFFGNPSHSLSLVGITGTNGKSTSAYLLNTIWEHLTIASALLGTVEYRLGSDSRQAPLTTPGSLDLQGLFAEMVSLDISSAVMEVSSIALDQSRPHGTRFSVALFTNLTQDHLDYHKNFEAYYNAKSRLFLEYDVSTAVINTDDTWGKRLIANLPPSIRAISYGLQAGCEIRASNAQYSLDGTKAKIEFENQALFLEIPLIGQHNLYNALGVLGCCLALHIPIKSAIGALRSATGAPGRLEHTAASPLHPRVYVDYAHTPDALENVLNALRTTRDMAHCSGRIITVFGCGGDRDRGKRPLMGSIAASLSDLVIVTSDNPRTENPESILSEIEVGIKTVSTSYLREVKRDSAIRRALELAKPSDIVLIAGKGHENYQVVGNAKLPFDDRQVIRDYFDSCSHR